MLRSKILDALKGYSFSLFAKDCVAGVIVGIVALPLAIAFAIASGVTPERGLYTAIIAGFLVALLGGSRVQVSGPTGAFIVIVYGIVQQYGYQGLVVADGMIGGKHRSNTELVAQGIANIFSPIFGGIPATGAIARTATNIKSGAQTPIAAIVHVLTLLLIMVCFGRWAGIYTYGLFGGNTVCCGLQYE